MNGLPVVIFGRIVGVFEGDDKNSIATLYIRHKDDTYPVILTKNTECTKTKSNNCKELFNKYDKNSLINQTVVAKCELAANSDKEYFDLTLYANEISLCGTL